VLRRGCIAECIGKQRERRVMRAAMRVRRRHRSKVIRLIELPRARAQVSVKLRRCAVVRQ